MRDTETGRKERGERGLAVQETWRQRDTQKHINTGMVGVVRKRFGEQQRGTRKQREAPRITETPRDNEIRRRGP